MTDNVLIFSCKAGITPGSLAIDPFVGSGSLIVAAAQFGARVLGSDIDYLVKTFLNNFILTAFKMLIANISFFCHKWKWSLLESK